MLVLILGSIGYLQWTYHWRGGTFFRRNWGRNWTMQELWLRCWLEFGYIVYVKELVLVEVHVISFLFLVFWIFSEHDVLAFLLKWYISGALFLNNRFCGGWIDLKTSGHFNFSHILYFLCSRINKSSMLWTNSNFYEKE